MLSPQDYELAARVLGLPMPETDAERAVAAPMVDAVVKNFHKSPPPLPGTQFEGLDTGATRSLNKYPDNNQPRVHDQLAHRLTAGVTDQEDIAEVGILLEMLDADPRMLDLFLTFCENATQDSQDSGEFLSQQRPLEYDLPSYGGQYSVLNAPSNSQIPPSQAYQPLS